MAAVKAEGVLKVIEALTGGFVAAVLNPAVGLEERGGAEISVAVPPVGGAGG